MKNKRYFIILTLIVLTCTSLKSIDKDSLKISSQSVQNILISKEWIRDNHDPNISVKFTLTEKQYFFQNESIGSISYYISNGNCYEQNFDPNKIGQQSNDDFLVTDTGCFFVKIINENRLEFHRLSEENPGVAIYIPKP